MLFLAKGLRESAGKEPCEGVRSLHLFLMRLLGPTTSSAQNIFLIRFLSQFFCGLFRDEKCGDLGESPGTLTTSDAGCIRKGKSALGAEKKTVRIGHPNLSNARLAQSPGRASVS